VVAEEKNDEPLDWSHDESDAEEQAAQQKAILQSFKSLKKVEDDTHAREEDIKKWWRDFYARFYSCR
jgi:uncharacterized FlaG/YvyC family protein